MIRTPILALLAMVLTASCTFAAGGTSGTADGAGRVENQVFGVPNMTQEEADANPPIPGQNTNGSTVIGASAGALGSSLANNPPGSCGQYETDCIGPEMANLGRTSDGDRLGQERLTFGGLNDLATGGVQRAQISQGIQNTGGNPDDPAQRDNFLLALLRGLTGLGR